jgi:hypothetical protein
MALDLELIRWFKLDPNQIHGNELRSSLSRGTPLTPTAAAAAILTVMLVGDSGRGFSK